MATAIASKEQATESRRAAGQQTANTRGFRIPLPGYSPRPPRIVSPTVSRDRAEVISPAVPPITSLLRPDLNELTRLYIGNHPQAVESFLVQHPWLVSVLLEAHPYLRASFPESPVHLTLVSGHDLLGPNQYLRVSIHTDLEPSEAVARLKDFDERWWLDSPVFPLGLLLFTLE